ncbi:MAG: hypothetical protein FWG42_11515, partial [Clostridiales bacterium]|nr:hypothetical protein [Clostridiales bacterium]
VIKGASEINTVVLNKGFGEPVHLSVEGDSYVTTCEVAAGSGAIISGSTIMTLSVEANAEVTITEGSVLAKVEINGANVILTIEKDGIITELTISADGNVDVEGEGSVTTTITIQSDGTTSTSSGETGSQGDGGNQGGSSQVADSGNQSGGGGSQGGGEPTAPIPTPKYGFLVDELTNVVDNSGRGTADFITTDGTRETLTITATSAIEVSISNTRFYKLIPDDPDYIAVPQYLVGEAVEDGVTFGDVTTMEITMAMFTLEGANNTNSFHSYSYARGGMSAVFIHEDYETPGDMYGTNNVGLDYAYNQAKDAGIVFVIHERIGGVNTAQATFVINWQADRTDFDGSSLVRPEPTPKYGFLVSESANVLDGAGRAAAEFITTDGVSETLTITATTAMNVTNDTTRFYKLVPVPGGTEWNATAVPHTSDNDFTLGYTFGDINPLELTSAMFTLIGVNNTDNFHIYNYASGGMRTVFVHEDYETPGDMYGTNNVGLDYAYRQAKDAGIVFVIHERIDGVNRAQATFVVNWQADRIDFGTDEFNK